MKSIKKPVSFLAVSLVLLMLTAAMGCGSAAWNSSTYNNHQVVKKEKWTEVGGNIFVFTSNFYMANMVLITDNGDGVLIDTGMDGNDKDKLQDFLKSNKINLKKIIITHLHSDHTGNLGMFKIPASNIITPVNAKDNQEVVLGSKTLKIIFTEGHFREKGHISVELPNDNILIAGDVICNNILPPIAAGGNIDDLLNTLEVLKNRNYSIIIPGHGEIVGSDLIFKRQFEYLNNAKKFVQQVISTGGTIEDLDAIKLEDCIADTSYLYNERLQYWHQESLKAIFNQLKKSGS